MSDRNQLHGSFGTYTLDDIALLEIAKFYKEHRIKEALTQRLVGEQLGFTCSQFVSNWERGHCQLPEKHLNSVIHLYNINKKELFNIYYSNARKSVIRFLRESN